MRECDICVVFLIFRILLEGAGITVIALSVARLALLILTNLVPIAGHLVDNCVYVLCRPTVIRLCGAKDVTQRCHPVTVTDVPTNFGRSKETC